MTEAIKLFMHFTGLVSEITEEDFAVIWKNVNLLSKPTKNKIIGVINDYYEKKYGKLPTFYICEGQEFDLAIYYLNLIKEELKKK